MVRLAIPRRVYTQTHFDYVVDVITKVAKENHKVKGLRKVTHPEVLAHFSATYEFV